MFPIVDHEDRTISPLEHVLRETGSEYPFEPRTPLAAEVSDPPHPFLRKP